MCPARSRRRAGNRHRLRFEFAFLFFASRSRIWDRPVHRAAANGSKESVRPSILGHALPSICGGALPRPQLKYRHNRDDVVAVLDSRSRRGPAADEAGLEAGWPHDLRRARTLTRHQRRQMAGPHHAIVEAHHRRLPPKPQDRRSHPSRRLSHDRATRVLSFWTSAHDVHLPGRCNTLMLSSHNPVWATAGR